MKLILPPSVASTFELAAIQREIHEYAIWSARTAIKKRVTMSAHTNDAPELSAPAKELIHFISGGKDVSAAMLDELQLALERHRNAAPTITFTLAAVPSGDLKHSLVEWVRRELDPAMLVTFRLNRAILGGMVVSYGSHVFDWSFRRKLLSSDVRFSEVLQRV